jgi:predicted transposase/invertase (TIGR01784 family)
LVGEAFHSTFALLESTSKTRLTDLLEIHFIEFPKFEEISFDLNNPLHRWLLFLKEDISGDLLREVRRMDVILNQAEEKLLRLSADPETRREYELREKALSDERSRLEDAREKGIVEGIEIGEKKGKEKAILEVVRKMMNRGIPLKEIALYTSYPVEELRKLLEKNNL